MFYIDQTIANNWSRSALENAIDLNDYSARGKAVNNFKETLPLPQQNLAKEILKDPYNFDFLAQREKFDEAELEDALSKNIEKFLLELGRGFSFVARQKHFNVDGRHFYIDLVFYNYILKCFVLIDLKAGDLTHQDIGQMQMYVHHYDRNVKLEDENPTIGILLCRDKNDAVVQMTLPEDNTQIFASKYETVLPSREKLQALLSEHLTDTEGNDEAK